jgi:hypothetical protein
MINDIPVMFVESPNGPAGSGEAFNQLESRLPILKGRKFYATYMYATNQYRACVATLDADEPKALGLEAWVIPGGKYAQQKLENWTAHADEIPGVFEKLSKENEDRLDTSRTSIEFYRSQRELICLIAIQ